MVRNPFYRNPRKARMEKHSAKYDEFVKKAVDEAEVVGAFNDLIAEISELAEQEFENKREVNSAVKATLKELMSVRIRGRRSSNVNSDVEVPDIGQEIDMSEVLYLKRLTPNEKREIEIKAVTYFTKLSEELADEASEVAEGIKDSKEDLAREYFKIIVSNLIKESKI